MAARMAMIAITTSSSIRVNAGEVRRGIDIPSFGTEATPTRRASLLLGSAAGRRIPAECFDRTPSSLVQHDLVKDRTPQAVDGVEERLSRQRVSGDLVLSFTREDVGDPCASEELPPPV